MKLVIIDDQGRELEPTRVSLINGGVEIVIAGIHGSTTANPAQTEKSDTRVDGPTSTKSDGAVAAGLFDSSGELPAAPQDDATDTAKNDVSNSESVRESSNNPSIMLDSTGRVWDERIDSSSKKTVKKTGIWSRRKNVEDSAYSAIVDELTLPSKKPIISALSQAVNDSVPDAPGDDLPTAPADDLPVAPVDEAPLPADNTIGGDDDAELKGILSDWS